MISYAIFSLLITILYSTRRLFKSKLNLFLIVFILFILTAFREYTIGNDTMSYYNFFNQINNGNIYFDPRFELGYRYLNIIISQFTDNFTYVLIISSFILYYALYKFYSKYSGNPSYSILFFWFLGFITLGNVTRQSIAIALVTVASMFLVNNKTKIFFFLVLFSSVFHFSALIMLIIFIFAKIKNKLKNEILIIIVIAAISFTPFLEFLIINVAPDYYSNYISGYSGILAVLFHSMMGLSFLLLSSFFSKTTERIEKDEIIYRISRWSTLMYVIFSIISLNFAVAGRVSYFFIPGMILFATHALRNRRVLRIITVLILLIYNLLAILYRPEWNSFFPYEFIF